MSQHASESNDDDQGSRHPPSRDQIDAVKQVLACGPKEYRKILGITRTGEDGREEKESIVNPLRKRGCLVHPDQNKLAGAEKAFKSMFDPVKIVFV